MKWINCLALMAMMLFSCQNAPKKELKVVADVAVAEKKENQKPAFDEEKSNTDKNQTADTTRYTSSKEPPPPKTSATNIDWDKKIIKTANVSLELKNFSSYNKGIHQNLKAYGAYIAQEEQTQTNDFIQNTVTIKVPVEQFENLMNSFSGEGIKLLEKKISTEDVTAEVIDTKGRIETKKQVRLQYMELLKQAKNMKDILEVQSEINAITEEVESAGGRVQYLTHQAAYSTINLKYLQYSSGVKPVDEEPGFFSKMKEAFKSGGNAIANIALFLMNIWPVIVVLVVGYVVVQKRSNKKSSAKQEASV
jgi:hypothetical protein